MGLILVLIEYSTPYFCFKNVHLQKHSINIYITQNIPCTLICKSYCTFIKIIKNNFLPKASSCYLCALKWTILVWSFLSTSIPLSTTLLFQHRSRLSRTQCLSVKFIMFFADIFSCFLPIKIRSETHQNHVISY